MPWDQCSVRAVGRAEPETESGQSYGLGGIGLGREAGPGRDPWWVGLQVGGPTGFRPVSLLALQRKMAPRKERVSTLPRLQLLVLLLLPLLLVPQPIAGHGGKYSREKNEPEMAAKRESGEEFRMEKLNQLWEKAKRVSGARETRGDGGEELRVSEGEQGPDQEASIAAGMGDDLPFVLPPF